MISSLPYLALNDYEFNLVGNPSLSNSEETPFELILSEKIGNYIKKVLN